MSKKTNAFLQGNQKDLQFLFGKVKELEALNKKIATYLDPSFANYCQVGNVMGNKLIIIVANGSIATELRFKTNDLIRRFKEDPLLRRIQEIQCKVRPMQQLARFNEHRVTMRKMAPLSAETAEIIHHIAESLEDPKLRAIMKRIAEHKTSGSSKE